MYRFTDTSNRHFETGMLFLGRDWKSTKHDVGIHTERHAITIAGAGAGKGAALIIPNLLRWPHSVIVIDVKGENAEKTWEAREAMGQDVYVLDPFRAANVPDRLRVPCNLLASIKQESYTAREDIRVIADGLVMRFKGEDATWDNGAVSVLSGVIAWVLSDPDTTERTLREVRSLLVMPDDARHELFKAMSQSDAFGGLCKAAAAIGLSDSRKNREFVGGAVDHSEWLDSPAMTTVLTGNGFDLSELKTKKTTVYLVLPPHYLGEHGRFLRLFVRAALDAMAKSLHGERCLFLLDEFYSLGRIDEIAKAAGLMRGYGVQLWPFLQDLGQLISLYRREGAETFFGNSDAHIFFGNTDQMTLEHISQRIGTMTINDVGVMPPFAPAPAWDFWNGQIDQAATGRRRADYETEMNFYSHRLREVGTPRFSPQEVRSFIGKGDGDVVARSMLVFAKGNDVLSLELAPYFLPPPPPPPPPAVMIQPRPTLGANQFARAVHMGANVACAAGFFWLFQQMFFATTPPDYELIANALVAFSMIGFALGWFIDLPPTGNPPVELWQRVMAWGCLFAVPVFVVAWVVGLLVGLGNLALWGGVGFAAIASMLGATIGTLQYLRLI